MTSPMQRLASPEPAVDRGSAEAQLGCDRLDVDAAAAQVAVERGVQHLLARRRGGAARSPRGFGLCGHCRVEVTRGLGP